MECDQGRARKAMVRLLERAHFRRNDAELFAGLVQACRYCDELDASIAAHCRGRHLDPHLITSAAHTYFLLGNYTNTLELYGTRGGYYLDCAALAAMGESQTALLKLRERERSGGTTGAVQGVMRSLRAYLEGNTKECLDAIAESALSADPEILFYSCVSLRRSTRPSARSPLSLRRWTAGFSAPPRLPVIHGLRRCDPVRITRHSCSKPNDTAMKPMLRSSPLAGARSSASSDAPDRR
jgi:hypothetical protein